METPSNNTHIAVCPSAGIGHLTPFLRIASMISQTTTSKVTLIIILPVLSSAETTHINSFLSTHPHISPSYFHTPSSTPPDPTISDPFFVRYDTVSRSSHLLADHLSSLNPAPRAVFSDLMLASGLIKPLLDRNVDCYTVITSSARFFSVMLSRGRVGFVKGEDVEIPGLGTVQGDEVPPLMYNSEHVLSRLGVTNCKHLKDGKGVVLNTFEFFENEAISALKSGQVLSDLPSVFPIGPLHPLPFEKGSNSVSWLDEQPPKSVVFVSFGSRTAMSKEQIKEIGEGLHKSGIKFLWVIKTAVVDKEDKEDLQDLLGEGFFERTKERGLVLKEWVNQDEILSHLSTGGFVTHCGWNSVMEAAQRGLPVLAWPLHGDQRINAAVVKAAGLGIWEREWGWVGQRLIKGDEVAEKIKELMTSEDLRESARRVGDEARKAWEKDGSSSRGFSKVLGMCMA
ncbi:hypothetical protein RND81_03G181900 [Saponaria officinalis]|uniref:Glycosyltransferase n=1 Tax=Saponaria officinalis TaxID=3572 RepID=A0AAW1M990_SAPOF